MNIIQVGPYPLSMDCIRGGVESSVFGLTQALIRAQHVVDVFDFPRINGKDTSERDGLLTIHRYTNNGKHNEDAILRAKEMFRDIIALHPDVVHIHGTGKISGVLYKAIQNYGIPVVLTVHGLLHEEKKQAFRRKPSLKHLYQYIVQSNAEFEILNDAKRIIVDTPYVAQKIAEYKKKGKISTLPEMYVIPQGINAEYYQMECSKDSNNILSVGAISQRKGHAYTIKMFNELRNKGVQAKLRIIGSLADTNYHAKLLKLIQRSPYEKDISIETNVSQSDVFEAYKSAHLFVLHSREESQGIVFAEAMATGLPIVATKVGGVPDVVENNKSGFLCEFGDAISMTIMVESLMSDIQLWQTYSQYAQTAALKYKWDTIAEQISQLYSNK